MKRVFGRPGNAMLAAGGALALLMAFAPSGPSRAEEHRGWHGHEMGRFREHDYDRWRGGHWWHGEHDGRAGWWWTIGPSEYYFYDSPAYPYPDPYIPYGVAAPAPSGAYWYWCSNPAGYYPYIPNCSVPWQPVVPH